MRQVEFFRRRVRQGVLVDDCLDFARYVRLSCICELMIENPPQGDNPAHTERLRELFPYDGYQLRREVDALEADCHEYYRGRTRDSAGTATGANKDDLAEISRKLDLMAGRLAALESVKPARVRKPKLRLVKARAAS
jgi:hypothetical protein